MYKSTSKMSFGMLLMLMSLSSHAHFIVNTGADDGNSHWSLFKNQWLGTEFTNKQGNIIDSVQGYMLGNAKENVTLALYTSGEDMPGDELFSAPFTVNDSIGWYGAANLNWKIAPGNYWVVFKVDQSSDFIGTFPDAALQPLINAAFKRSDGQWKPFDALNLAVRINASPVPGPAAWLLFSFGLVCLFKFKRQIAF